MNLFEKLGGLERQKAQDLFTALEEELADSLALYWAIASKILQGGGIKLLNPRSDYTSLRRNFFSILFLYSYHRGGITKARRKVYASINQCLRGMVTGCDNLLDDEFKPTLATNLPENATKFRSVLDIMVSDRVLFQILLDEYRKNGMDLDQASSASSATLRALTRSGAQEASEEGGIKRILEPAEVLKSIHHFKTGLLFQCTWAVPRIMESWDEKRFSPFIEALHQIGMGCQIMDDMVDLPKDLEEKRHNLIVSLVHYGESSAERERLKAMSETECLKNNRNNPLLEFPQARQNSARTAQDYLQEGLGTLFPPDHHFLVQPVVETLAGLIGADRFMFHGDH